MNTSIFSSPKVDCHCHILDPNRFAYAPDVHYRPTGQETGSAGYFSQVLDAYGVQHALLVEPNSGYGLDNRCMLAAIAHGNGRYKGIATVPNDASAAQLQDLQAQGIVGIAFNVALLGLDFYRDIGPLLARLTALDMFAQIQVDGDQLVRLSPMLLGSGAAILIDHCGRPDVSQGLNGTGFSALLAVPRSNCQGFQNFQRKIFRLLTRAVMSTRCSQHLAPTIAFGHQTGRF
jgi:predicted TIM-barrel fold metal-dependent hydrolase